MTSLSGLRRQATIISASSDSSCERVGFTTGQSCYSEEVDNHRQIQPAMLGADISNIGGSDLICPENNKQPLHAIRGND